ncbi:MAG: HprK-related kinase A [Thiohalocapsa sp.]
MLGVRSTPLTLAYQTGPFTVKLRTDLPALATLANCFYGDLAPAAVVDFNLRIRRVSGWRRWWRPQAIFISERTSIFEPYPAEQAFPLLEWGTNWCISMRAHQFLMLHAGVVERGGRALLLPALPGSGKSTLSAALACRGWRFLTDEIGLVDHRNGQLAPLPRAIPLKNQSIDVIQDLFPNAWIGPRFENTRKGTVAHMRPPAESLVRQQECAVPAWIVFPRYRAGWPTRIEGLEKSVAFTRLSQNAFNYRHLGATGFSALCGLILACDCWSLQYSDLDHAIATLGELTGTRAPA